MSSPGDRLRPHQFKPGISGNPAGRQKLSPELAAISEIGAHELKRIVSKYLRMSKAQLGLEVQRSDIPMLDLNIAAILAHGAKTGDHSKLDFLLTRIMGRAPMQELPPKENDLSELSNEQLIELAKSHVKTLEGKVEERIQDTDGD